LQGNKEKALNESAQQNVCKGGTQWQCGLLHTVDGYVHKIDCPVKIAWKHLKLKKKNRAKNRCSITFVENIFFLAISPVEKVSLHKKLT